MVLYAVSEMEIHVFKKKTTLFPAVPALLPKVQGLWGVFFYAYILMTA